MCGVWVMWCTERLWMGYLPFTWRSKVFEMRFLLLWSSIIWLMFRIVSLSFSPGKILKLLKFLWWNWQNNVEIVETFYFNGAPASASSGNDVTYVDAKVIQKMFIVVRDKLQCALEKRRVFGELTFATRVITYLYLVKYTSRYFFQIFHFLLIDDENYK